MENMSAIDKTEKSKSHKFSTEFKVSAVTEDIPDTEEQRFESLELNQHPEIGTFSFGYRFYYWSYYTNTQEEDYQYNAGRTFKEMSVVHKFGNLKEEILDKLPLSCYELTIEKCQHYMKSEEIRKLRASPCDKVLHYGIRGWKPIGFEHVFSVALYTDYDKLCDEFSKSFRKEEGETLESLKKRNGEYFWWSKLLRETVEYFGDDTKTSSVSKFYHGTSRLYFSQFNAYFFGPTSTSAQIEVW